MVVLVKVNLSILDDGKAKEKEKIKLNFREKRN